MFPLKIRKSFLFLFVIILSFIVLSGCQNTPEVESTVPPTDVQPTETPLPPTPTPEPLAASVNGNGILLATYEAELLRYQKALEEIGKAVDNSGASDPVINNLIDQTLLQQAAASAGFVITTEFVEEHITQLVEQMGGAEVFAQWLSENQFTEASFQEALSASLAAAWQRDQIANAVPETASQVHARQILVFDQESADEVYDQLESGADFATLSNVYDPLTGGDLGWFPKGYLFLPEIEEAAFNLTPGDYSQVIGTDYGFHIIQLIERDEERELLPDVRKALQQAALDEWLKTQREESQIEVYLP